MTRGYLTAKSMRTTALGVHQYTYHQYQVLYFIFVVSTVHSFVKRKANVFLL